MSAIVERFKTHSSSSKSGRGKAVSVYDGRSWPVIKCGAVYVTESDKTKHVTKNIIAQTASPEDKKKRSSKYSLAVGSSFGHVHTFLKDSEHVLNALDNTKAEDKCLMLIRKPKSSSKQMLKAHSWANLSATDMHLRRPDGSLKPNQNPHTQQHKLSTSGDYTLPRDQYSKWQQQPTNQISPNKGLSDHSSSFKELSTVVEQSQENTNTQVQSRQHRHSDSENGNFMSHQYPEQSSNNLRNYGRAVSSIDLRQTDAEINNNNRMGGAFNKSRPKGPPPPVPSKTFKNNKTQSKQGQNRSPHETQVYCVDNDPRKLAMNSNRPDVILNVHDKGSMPNNRSKKTNVHIAHAKSDSGFCSDTRISSDEMYDYGFKQELELNNHMTSSPRSKEENGYSDQRPVDKRHGNRNVQNSQSNKMKPEPQSYTHRPVLYEKNTNVTKQQMEKGRSKSDSVDRYHSKEHFIQNGLSKSKENLSQSEPRSNYTRNDKPNIQTHKHPISPYNAPPKPERAKQQQHSNSPHHQHTDSRNNQPTKQPTPNKRPTGDYNRQKSQEQQPSPMRDDQVFRAHSMGDLSTGCAFSLVGQKRDENIDDVNSVGLSGSQLTEHFRKYRKIKQESKHGSLPFRGKAVDDADIRMRLDEIQYNQPPSYQKVKAQKALHYGSLQHLPMSSESNNSENRQVLPTKFREKTPMKPRRSLPQVPGDVDEKKKQLSEVVKTRICASRNSSSSPSSGGSNRASEVRIGGGISATPSDREVSVLLGHNQTDIVVVPPKNKTNWCNNTSSDSIHGHILPPDSYYNTNYHHPSGSSDSYGHQEQNSSAFTAPSGGRLSESGQTTLTSQSTIDSGYITNDPDQDPLSTSNYAKSVKQSAQNLYTSNKMFKSPKGDHSQVFMQNLNKGGKSSDSKEKVSSSKHGKEAHTRNWLEKHPGSYMGDTLKLGLNRNENHDTQRGISDKLDTNNNKNPKNNGKNVTELDLTDKSRQKDQSNRSHTLIHHLSDPSGKESEKSTGGDIGQFRNKGMSISMSQGLNMIEKNSKANSGGFLSKSQPKFTGSLKDLLGADKQIVPIEALKVENPQLNSTLPINFKFQHKPETSLKLLGKPSLFQLLQNYNLYAARMTIPEGFKILDNIRMIECEVVLPSLWLHSTESQLSPQGNYAKLGGPFSAFRPVSNQCSQIKSVSMVTVMDLSNQLTGCFESGSIIKGDLVVEVNERLMVGENLSSINTLLQGCHGEVLWTIARDKARDGLQDRKSSSPTNEDFHRMKNTITELTSELRKKDRALKQLNALLPWKQNNEKKEGDTKDQDRYITLSDDEFIV